jgi:hypothetical protein
MKLTKHRTLVLVQHTGAVRARHLVEAFDYSADGARSYLSHLAGQDLVQRTSAGYVLTPKGADRLAYFGVVGCGQDGCRLCKGKEGVLTCPACGVRLQVKAARVVTRGFPFGDEGPGVFCPSLFCGRQLLTEAEARQLGIRANASATGLWRKVWEW